MNFLFCRKYKYTVYKPIEWVREEFSQVTSNRWSNFPGNITGTLRDDNSFSLTHRWVLGMMRGLSGGNFASLTGTLTASGEVTLIETRLRPDTGMVIFLYGMALVFLCELFGIRTMLNAPRLVNLFVLTLFGLILYGLMLLLTNGLRRTFERVFNLQAE